MPQKSIPATFSRKSSKFLLQTLLKLAVGVLLKCFLGQVLVNVEVEVVGLLEDHGAIAAAGPSSCTSILLLLKLVFLLLVLHFYINTNKNKNDEF